MFTLAYLFLMLDQFIAHLQKAFDEASFVKLTFSKPQARPDGLANIYVRRILIRQRWVLSFTFRYPKRDEVKNFTLAEALPQIREWAGAGFGTVALLTTESDYFWDNKTQKIRRQAATHKAAPSVSHDQAKQYDIAENAPFLTELGISSQQGKVLGEHRDKFKQINKYVEIMDSFLPIATAPNQPLRVLDMGSGKGYLTFALFAHWQQTRQLNLKMRGIELRPNLVDFCNQTAQKLEWDKNLDFVAADIQQYEHNYPVDILIALHACDIATDIAIAKGIQNRAKVIVVAPCCHKQIRKELKANALWAPILKNGILEERQAELLTDGIRALILEAYGYKTKVFEFISPEHTSKNIMITAVRTNPTQTPNAELMAQVQALKAEFGIYKHALETCLEPA